MSQYTLQEVKWVEMDESELDVDWAEKKSTVPISGFGSILETLIFFKFSKLLKLELHLIAEWNSMPMPVSE